MDRFSSFTLLVVSVLTFSGCSVTPWQQTSLSLNEQDEYQQIIHQIDIREQQCSKGFDADVLITLSNSLQNKSISGYLAVLAPGKIKFIVSTPFGQPFYIATTDKSEYQLIDVAGRSYHRGTLQQLATIYELPDILSQIDGTTLLSGMLTKERPELPTIYRDRQERGFWISWQEGNFVLIEPNIRRVLARRIVSDDDETVEIEYRKWQEETECARPTKINISGLSYGSAIDIQLSKIQHQPFFSKKQFTVQIPKNFKLIQQ